MKDSPKTKIPIARGLRFTPLSPGRLATFVSIANQPGVQKYLFENIQFTLFDAKAFLRRSQALDRELGLCVYLVFKGKTVIGFAGFIRMRHDPDLIEIMYAVGDAESGKGLGTLITAALVQTAKESGSSLSAVVAPQNLASVRLLTKLQFQRQGSAPGDLSHLDLYFSPLRI